MKGTLFAALVLLLTACATGSNHGPTYSYKEVLVENNSQETINNLTIKETGTDRVYSCGDIAALGVCSKRFGRQGITGSPFTVDMGFGENERETIEIAIAVPAYSAPGIAQRMIFEISPQGEVSARIEQMTPS